jgi:cytoskeletal protein CcmA (bactofilin family)
VASLIGRYLTVVGSELQIVTKGDFIVEGTVTGDVLAADITIGPEAVVTGLVNAGVVTVAGTVSGNIRAAKIALHSTAKVSAELHHNSLIIEEGAKFEGKSLHSDDPAVLAPDLDRTKSYDQETRQAPLL